MKHEEQSEALRVALAEIGRLRAELDRHVGCDELQRLAALSRRFLDTFRMEFGHRGPPAGPRPQRFSAQDPDAFRREVTFVAVTKIERWSFDRARELVRDFDAEWWHHPAPDDASRGTR